MHVSSTPGVSEMQDNDGQPVSTVGRSSVGVLKDADGQPITDDGRRLDGSCLAVSLSVSLA